MISSPASSIAIYSASSSNIVCTESIKLAERNSTCHLWTRKTGTFLWRTHRTTQRKRI